MSPEASQTTAGECGLGGMTQRWSAGLERLHGNDQGGDVLSAIGGERESGSLPRCGEHASRVGR